MKITELKCTACNGDLKIDPQNPNIAVCEYCKSRYAIEHEAEDQVHIRQEASQPPRPGYQEYRGSSQSGGGKSNRVLPSAVIIILGVIVLVCMQLPRFLTETGSSGSYNPGKNYNTSVGEHAVQPREQEPFEGGMAIFVETVYGKAQDQVTDADLAQIQWLAIRGSLEGCSVGYSKEDPYGDEPASLQWIPVGNVEIDKAPFARFSNLKKLEWNHFVSKGSLSGLHLVGLICDAETPQALAESLSYPEELKELKLENSVYTLEGITAFPNLESLSLGCANLTDISPLAMFSGIKKLELLRADEITDFSVLGTFGQLEVLSIDASSLKSLDFLSRMGGLKSLSIEGASLLNLDDVADLSGLETFVFLNGSDTQNMDGLSGLSGLKELRLERQSGCTQPDLSGLTGLKTLSIRNFEDLGFLRNLSNLERLSMKYCQMSDTSVFAGLSQLKELTYISTSLNVVNWNFVAGLPALEKLDMTGVTTYYDISGAFAAPMLREVILDGVECELDFEKLAPNPSIKKLVMNGMKLYENVDIQGGGGIYSVDYDKVSLDDHLDFLTRFPNLESLSLSGNKLSKIDAVSSLVHLKELDISDNFITDLKPLSALSQLESLYVKGNPIENFKVIGEEVQVVK